MDTLQNIANLRNQLANAPSNAAQTVRNMVGKAEERVKNLKRNIRNRAANDLLQDVGDIGAILLAENKIDADESAFPEWFRGFQVQPGKGTAAAPYDLSAGAPQTMKFYDRQQNAYRNVPLSTELAASLWTKAAEIPLQSGFFSQGAGKAVEMSGWGVNDDERLRWVGQIKKKWDEGTVPAPPKWVIRDAAEWCEGKGYEVETADSFFRKKVGIDGSFYSAWSQCCADHLTNQIWPLRVDEVPISSDVDERDRMIPANNRKRFDKNDLPDIALDAKNGRAFWVYAHNIKNVPLLTVKPKEICSATYVPDYYRRIIVRNFKDIMSVGRGLHLLSRGENGGKPSKKLDFVNFAKRLSKNAFKTMKKQLRDANHPTRYRESIAALGADQTLDQIAGADNVRASAALKDSITASLVPPLQELMRGGREAMAANVVQTKAASKWFGNRQSMSLQKARLLKNREGDRIDLQAGVANTMVNKAPKRDMIDEAIAIPRKLAKFNAEIDNLTNVRGQAAFAAKAAVGGFI